MIETGSGFDHVEHGVNAWETYLRFRDRIAGVLDQRLHPIEWLDAQVYAGLARIIAEGESCILYEFKAYPSGALEVHGLVAVGDIKTITGPIKERFEQIGREAKCLFATVASRPGWERALPDYHTYQVTVRKEL